MSIVVDIVKGAVDLFVDAVEAVGEVVVSVVKPIANFVGSAVETVVNLADDILDVAGTLIENYAVQAAFVAMGVPPVYAAPLTASTTTLARGGSFQDALKAGAVSIATTKVSNTVFSQARAAGFSVTEATAAASAASSATATAAYGGDLRDILRSGAIGGISSAAGSQVMEATDNKYLANFVRTSTSAALRGQKLDQAILMGASASTIQYLDEYIELANAQDKLVEEWKDEAAAYTRAVNNYNDAVETLQGIQRSIEIYQDMNNQSMVDMLVNQFNDLYATLPDLEAAYRDAEATFLPFDRQLRNLQRPMDELLQKAAEELGEQITDWEVPIEQELQSEEQRIIQQIQQVAERPALAPLDETLLAGPVPVAASPVQQAFDRGEKIIGQTQQRDSSTGETLNIYTVQGLRTGDINQLAPTDVVDPRTLYEYKIVIGEDGLATYEWGGMDPDTMTVTIQSSRTPPDPNNYNQAITSETAPIETPVEIGEYTPQFSSNLTQLQVENQIIQSQLENIVRNIADVNNEVKALQSQKSQLDSALADAQKIQSEAINQQTANEAQKVIDQIQTQKTQIDQAIANTQAQIDTLNAQRQPLNDRIQENAATEQQLIDAERERMFIRALDEAIVQLEQDVEQAKSDEEAAQAQARFVQKQRNRLKRKGILSQTSDQTLEGELSRLLDEYEQAQQTGASASERLSELRPEGGGVGGPITDEEVIRYLGLSGEEASRYGLGGPGTGDVGTGGPGAGVSGEGGPGITGGEGGEGLVGGGTPEDAEATETEPAPITEVPQPPESGIGAFTPIVPQQEPRTQGISGRVTGQSLVGILGDKEPTFGGDPGQQQEVWNIRSLRLRRALGL